jgi:hypothetical protein
MLYNQRVYGILRGVMAGRRGILWGYHGEIFGLTCWLVFSNRIVLFSTIFGMMIPIHELFVFQGG